MREKSFSIAARSRQRPISSQCAIGLKDVHCTLVLVLRCRWLRISRRHSRSDCPGCSYGFMAFTRGMNARFGPKQARLSAEDWLDESGRVTACQDTEGANVHRHLSIVENELQMHVASRGGVRPFTATKVSIDTFVQWIGLSSSG